MRGAIGVVMAVAFVGVGCGEEPSRGPLCDASEVAAALLDARSGDTVRLGACTIAGAFVVPGGVTVVGAGVGETRLVGPGGGVAVDLLPRADAVTKLSDLTVESPGLVGVRADGAGRLLVERVTVEASAGVALGIVSATEAVLRDVELVGPVTADNASDPVFLLVAPTADVPVPESCSGEPECEADARQSVDCPSCGQVEQVCNACGHWVTVTAAYGLALEATEAATLERVNVSGFASFGVVLRERTPEGASAAGVLSWTGGTIATNLGVGLYADGAVSLDLHGVTIDDTLSGQRGLPSYGAVVVDGVALTTTDLTLRDNDRYGLVQSAATAHHTALEATGNGDAALWVGDSDGFTIAGGSIRGNTFAGIVVNGSSGVTLEDLEVSGTAEALHMLGPWGAVRVGDGIQLVDTTEDVSLTRVLLADNTRVGLLVDLGDAEVSPLVLQDVTVRAEGTSLGAIAGTADQDTHDLTPGGPAGWDDGVTREGATAANDLAAASALDFAPAPDQLPIPGIVTPCD